LVRQRKRWWVVLGIYPLWVTDFVCGEDSV